MGRTRPSARLAALISNGIGGTVFASIYDAEPLDFFPLDDIEAFIAACAGGISSRTSGRRRMG